MSAGQLQAPYLSLKLRALRPVRLVLLYWAPIAFVDLPREHRDSPHSYQADQRLEAKQEAKQDDQSRRQRCHGVSKEIARMAAG
jgi:hypothetical protein